MSTNRDSQEKVALSSSQQWKTLKKLSHYLWPASRFDLKLRVIIALCSLGISKLFNVYVPFLYKHAVDGIGSFSHPTAPTSLKWVIGIIIAYGGARILHSAFGEFRDFIFIKVSQHAQRVIALNTFKHLHALSLRFHLDRQTGGLSRVIERGTNGIQFLLNFMLFNILPTLIEIILVTGILFYTFDIQFAAITLGTIIIYILFTLLTTEWRIKFRQQMNAADSDANTKSIDSLINYETVKYFGNEEHEYHRFDQSLADYEKAAIQSHSSLSLLNFGQWTIIGIGLIILMSMAAAGVKSGDMTIGDFVMVNTFLIQLYLPLNFLGFVYRQIKQSLIDMEKMFELLEINAEVSDAPNAKSLSIKDGKIEFKNVCFGYEKDRQILKNISFIVPPGKTTAIVGPSGAGKSTISKLLFRFYNINSGSILIDQQNIEKVTQKSLRSGIGIVPQDTVLFNDTIHYNIAYGIPDAQEKDIIRVSKLAKIDDFIMSLPNKYQSRVGERGLKLSGGEKQRVAIARTMLKNPEILLFDEATSSLDSHTEKEIQLALEDVSRNHTTLIIAHRLSTIVNADEIIVLNEGEIIERGDHATLLQKGGQYASMWRRQQNEQEYQEKLRLYQYHSENEKGRLPK